MSTSPDSGRRRSAERSWRRSTRPADCLRITGSASRRQVAIGAGGAGQLPRRVEVRENPTPSASICRSPTKGFILAHRDDEKYAKYYELCFAKRPAEELYDIARDPHQMTNVAERPDYAGAKRTLRAELERWMKETADPRATYDDDRWDKYPYYGAPAKAEK